MFENVSYSLEMALQVHDQYSAMLSLTNGALILKIYLACNFTDALFSFRKFEETSSTSCLSRTGRALPRANLHISAYCACAMHPRVLRLVLAQKLPLLSGKIRNAVSVCCCFSRMTDSGTFETPSILLECPTDVYVQIRQSRNGRHVW